MDKSSELNNDQSTSRKKILKAIEERGFSLELETYLALRKRNWFTTMQSFFVNVQSEKQDKSLLEAIRDTWNAPAEPTYRTIDVTAMRVSSSNSPLVSNMSLGLIVECKYRKKEHWAFYTEPVTENQSIRLIQAGVEYTGGKEGASGFGALSFGELSSFGDLTKGGSNKTLNHKIAMDIRRTSHHSISKVDQFSLAHSSVFASPNTDSIYDACMQVLGASVFFAKSNPEIVAKQLNDSKPINYWRLYPVVVFSGPIWSVSLNPQQDAHLKPLEWTTYLYPYKGSWSSIDIVSFRYLDNYLAMLDDEFKSLQQCVDAEM